MSKLAIIIPVYKHPVLLNDALRSALREVTCNDGKVVIVNDGCPFIETHEICSTYADSYPRHIDYIRTKNGGLSAARNRGIKHALSRFPEIQAIYLLDADNRLSVGAMSRALKTMEEHKADWVYPNIDKFGLEWSGDFAAPYSLFRHLFQNVCEAGSLVHRRIFDAGICFDETMRKGYEDWEFWLQCADAGFRGVPCEDFGFQYRARRESMLKNSDREGPEILAYMYHKHARLYDWKNILALEHADAPRFCIIDTARRKRNFCSIPSEDGAVGALEDIDKIYWQSVTYPVRYHFPNFIISISNVVIKELNRLRLTDWLFFELENALAEFPFAFVVLQSQPGKISVSVTEGTIPRAGAPWLNAHIAATHRACLEECIADPSPSWICSLASESPQPPFKLITVSGPFSTSMVRGGRGGGALISLLDLFNQLRGSPWRQESGAWDWRHQEDGLIPLRDLYLQTRGHMRAFAPLARGASAHNKEAAFVMPVLSFGGVEQVAIQVAKQFKAAGWSTRAVVTERQEIESAERPTDAFDAICFLNDPRALDWSPTGQKYYGHDIQTWDDYGRTDRLIGLVAGCDAVLNFQAQHTNGVMGWLRRQGVVTVTSLHLFDRDRLFSPVGHPYLTLAYEHAYELITSPSRSLMHSLKALGVPEHKLVYLPNASSFVVDDTVRTRRLQEVAATRIGPGGRALRLLSLGRLDRQKGIERIVSVIEATKERKLAVEWRIIGAAVIGDPAEPKSNVAGVPIERPIYDRDQLVKLILWADAMLLLSHWEGSPLTILEAQNLGVVPVVTDVGGVREMIQNEVDGLIVPNGGLTQVTEATLAVIQRLIIDNEWRVNLAENACARQNNHTWDQTAKLLVSRVIDAATRPRDALVTR
jgi:glycosyltransferase involved in cell wall biosynthesis